MSQLERISFIDARIRRRGGVRLREVSDRFEISDRQARRDIEYLSERLGAPVEWNPSERKYEYSEAWNDLEFADEKSLLFYVFARAAAGTLAYVPLAEEKSLKRLLELMPQNLRIAAEKLRYELPEYDPADLENLALLVRALADGLCVDASYTDAHGKPSRRRMEPARLVNYAGSWYCVAFDHTASALRTFRLSRFSELSISSDKISRSPDPSEVDRFLDSSYGMFKGAGDKTAVLRFYGKAVPIVRNELWHADQVRTEGKDPERGPYLEFSVPVSVWDEILGRILRFGSDAEAVAPPEFRELWKDEIRRMASAVGLM